jgi:hypothetical protein
LHHHKTAGLLKCLHNKHIPLHTVHHLAWCILFNQLQTPDSHMLWYHLLLFLLVIPLWCTFQTVVCISEYPVCYLLFMLTYAHKKREKVCVCYFLI